MDVVNTPRYLLYLCPRGTTGIDEDGLKEDTCSQIAYYFPDLSC
jgi:hypothetical protein